MNICTVDIIKLIGAKQINTEIYAHFGVKVYLGVTREFSACFLPFTFLRHGSLSKFYSAQRTGKISLL